MNQRSLPPVHPLPAAVNGGPSSLSREARARIKALSGPRPGRFLLSAAITWLSIALLITVAELAQHWLVTLPVLFLIATRQMALGYLMHDQAHYLGFNTRYGDLVANLLVAYPLLLVTVDKYAQVHLTHHHHYFQERDPDFQRKRGEEWQQPMPLRQLLGLFLRDLSGLNVLRLIRGKTMNSTPYPRRGAIPAWVRPLYFIVLALLLTWLGAWPGFLLYWLLPLLTFFQVISRLGALCEHRYNLPEASLENSTPVVLLPWWQRLLVPDLNFHYHIYHHYFPGVSFSQLPAVHRIFQEEGLVNEPQVFRGYGDYFRRAVIRQTD